MYKAATLIWLIAFLALLLFPISLVLEFGSGKSATYATFDFCLHYYPHIALFCWAIGSGAMLCLYAAFLGHRDKSSAGYFLFASVLGLLLSAVPTYVDLVGPHMMIFEFNKQAQQPDRFRLVERAVLPKVIDDAAQPNPTATNDLFTFKSEQSNTLSASRWLYATALASLFFLVAMTFFATLPTVLREPPNSFRPLVLLVAILMELLWFPLRSYYNLKVKGPLFGDDSFAPLPKIGEWGIGLTEILLVVVLSIPAAVFIWRYGDWLSKKDNPALKSAGSLLKFFGIASVPGAAAALVSFTPKILDQIDVSFAVNTCIVTVLIGSAFLLYMLFFTNTDLGGPSSKRGAGSS